MSPFNYSPAGHVITGNVDIVVLKRGSEITEPWSFIWRQNFVSIINAVEDYAKRWAKHDTAHSKDEILQNDTLSIFYHIL
jgi:hypothetical protein